MRLIRLLFLLILMVGITLSATAQEDEQWYYTLTWESKQLFAYTADGDTRVLIEAGIEEIHYIRRINARNAISAITISGNADRQLYLLTPDEARLLVPSFDAATLEESELLYVLLDFTDDYAVLTFTINPGGGTTGFLADFNAGTLSLLSEYPISTFGHTHFSRDGQLVRYVTYDSDENDVWSLRERTLTTGEERVIYTGTDYPFITGDEFGEHWLVNIANENEENPGRTFLLLDTIGNSEIVGNSTRENPIEVWIVENYLFQFHWECSEECRVTLTPISGGEAREFIAPITSETLLPIMLPDPDHLLVLNEDDDTLYLTSESEEPILVGGYSLQNVGQPVQQLLSPDSRYMLVLTQDEEGEPEGYGVWDFVAQQLVVRNVPENFLFVLIYYSDSGFLVTEGNVKFYLYRYADEELIELPMEAGGCFDVLPGGDVLCSVREESEGLTTGIYRYSPDESAYMLLVEGGLPMRG